MRRRNPFKSVEDDHLSDVSDELEVREKKTTGSAPKNAWLPKGGKRQSRLGKRKPKLKRLKGGKLTKCVNEIRLEPLMTLMKV